MFLTHHYPRRAKNNVNCNIAERLNEKKYLVETMLNLVSRSLWDKELNVVPVVVIANANVNIANENPNVRCCYACDIPHFITEYHGKERYSQRDIDKLSMILNCSGTSEKYPIHFEFIRFAELTAEVITSIEEGENAVLKLEETKKIEIENEFSKSDKKHNKTNVFVRGLLSGAAVIASITVGVLLGGKKR